MPFSLCLLCFPRTLFEFMTWNKFFSEEQNVIFFPQSSRQLEWYVCWTFNQKDTSVSVYIFHTLQCTWIVCQLLVFFFHCDLTLYVFFFMDYYHLNVVPRTYREREKNKTKKQLILLVGVEGNNGQANKRH